MSAPPILPPKRNDDQQLLASNAADSHSVSQNATAHQVQSDSFPAFELLSKTAPDYLKALPIKNLKELITNHELLRDYLLGVNAEQIKDLRETVLEQIELNLGALKELEEKLDTTIVPKQESLLKDLNRINAKFKDIWSTKELEMYELLNKYSQENLIRKMNIAVLEADDLSKSLYLSLLQKEKLSDADVTKFIDDYIEGRQLYHLRKEKLYRLKESRVSG